MASWLRDAMPVVFNFGPPGSIDIAPWFDRVGLIDGTYDGAWELPDAGIVSAPSAVLVRPDGHVAWVGEGTRTGLDEALATWFAPPADAGTGPG